MARPPPTAPTGKAGWGSRLPAPTTTEVQRPPMLQAHPRPQETQETRAACLRVKRPAANHTHTQTRKRLPPRLSSPVASGLDGGPGFPGRGPLPGEQAPGLQATTRPRTRRSRHRPPALVSVKRGARAAQSDGARLTLSESRAQETEGQVKSGGDGVPAQLSCLGPPGDALPACLDAAVGWRWPPRPAQSKALCRGGPHPPGQCKPTTRSGAPHVRWVGGGLGPTLTRF